MTNDFNLSMFNFPKCVAIFHCHLNIACTILTKSVTREHVLVMTEADYC
jgi:hypothetical protein